ncbi:hypothetical protein AAC387_Pa06g1731 [Persea americana]
MGTEPRQYRGPITKATKCREKKTKRIQRVLAAIGIPFCKGDAAVMGRNAAAMREEGRRCDEQFFLLAEHRSNSSLLCRTIFSSGTLLFFSAERFFLLAGFQMVFVSSGGALKWLLLQRSNHQPSWTPARIGHPVRAP